MMTYVFVAVAVLFAVLVINAINILREYERGVVFTLGRYAGTKGPGLIIVWPLVQQMVRVDLRTIVLDVLKQAAAMLVEAAKLLGADPRAIQLRYMQTLTELGNDRSTTIVFPMPMDLLTPFVKKLGAPD